MTANRQELVELLGGLDASPMSWSVEGFGPNMGDCHRLERGRVWTVSRSDGLPGSWSAHSFDESVACACFVSKVAVEMCGERLPQREERLGAAGFDDVPRLLERLGLPFEKRADGGIGAAGWTLRGEERWLVFWSERGYMSRVEDFASEQDACRLMLARVRSGLPERRILDRPSEAPAAGELGFGLEFVDFAADSGVYATARTRVTVGEEVLEADVSLPAGALRVAQAAFLDHPLLDGGRGLLLDPDAAVAHYDGHPTSAMVLGSNLVVDCGRARPGNPDFGVSHDAGRVTVTIPSGASVELPEQSFREEALSYALAAEEAIAFLQASGDARASATLRCCVEHLRSLRETGRPLEGLCDLLFDWWG